jgi:epoxyqueuosine reductase QueG
MDALTRNVVHKLLEWGADLVGIAPVEKFAEAPEGHRPTDFMPECKSVISIGLHLFNEMADIWGDQADMTKTLTPYLFYGYGLTNLESSKAVNRMARALEYKGHKTLAFMPTWTSSMAKYFDTTLVSGELKAEFSHRHAAVASGIASFGWNGLAMTPEFGTMNRFNSLLTSAELEPTPMYDGPDICRPDLCGHKCAKICPAGAISTEESQTCRVGDKEFTYGVHDNIRCVYAILAMIKDSGGRSEETLPEGLGDPARLVADQESGEKLHLYDKAMIDNCFGIICGDFCGKCLHKCPSRKVIKETLKDYDFSARYSSLNHPIL